MSAPRSDEPLDLGVIEPGKAPAGRIVPAGAHPWAPTTLDEYETQIPVE